LISDACFMHSAIERDVGRVVASASFREPISAIPLVEAMCGEVTGFVSPLLRCLTDIVVDLVKGPGSSFGQAFQKLVIFRIWQMWWSRKSSFTVGLFLEMVTGRKWVAGDSLSPAWLSDAILANCLTLDEHMQQESDPSPSFYLDCNEHSFRIGIPTTMARMDGVAAMGKVLVVVGVKILKRYAFDVFYDNVMSTDPALAFLGNPTATRPRACSSHPLFVPFAPSDDQKDAHGDPTAALLPENLRENNHQKRSLWADTLQSHR
jgi:hypothetical protein